MDPFTHARIADQQAIQQAAEERQREEQQRMVGAAALEEMKRAQDRAHEAARQRQMAEEAHNRMQGMIDNWR